MLKKTHDYDTDWNALTAKMEDVKRPPLSIVAAPVSSRIIAPRILNAVKQVAVLRDEKNEEEEEEECLSAFSDS